MEAVKSQEVIIGEKEKENINFFLNSIEQTIKSLENGEEGFDYADTGDSIEDIDGILRENSAYQALLPLRREASSKIINGSDEEKKEGFKQIKDWMAKIREML